MTNKRATILISGDVQDAGFRGKVMRMAQKQELVGYIENLPDGTVRLVCEGEDKIINDFVNELDIHDEDIEVEKVDVEWSDATGEFKWFEVKFDNLGMEMFQGFATAGKKLGEIRTEMHSGFSDLKNETRSGFSDLKNEMQSGFSDLKSETHSGFSDLKNEMQSGFSDLKNETRSGFSDLKSETRSGFSDLKEESKKTHEALDSIDNRLGDVIDRYGEFGEKMTSLEHNIGDLTWQIKRLVDHVVGEEVKEE